MKTLVYFSIIIYYLLPLTSTAQNINPDILHKQWSAFWVTVPNEAPNSYGVYLFRKKINLTAKPTSFVIHVSADNRYKLYINEQLVSLGPARGDLEHWNFETVDIAPYLNAGNNIVAAQVWNDAEFRAEAQISLRTGFIIQGESESSSVLNTNNSWKCARDNGYRPLRISMNTYYVAGPGEQIDMNLHPADWNKSDFIDDKWNVAQKIFEGLPKDIMGGYGSPNGWMLVPSAIPQVELKQQRLLQLRRVEGITAAPEFPASKTPLAVPANTTATLVLDQTFLTNAYPTLLFSGGKDATLSLSYAEGLFTKYPSKGNRNEIEGKKFIGRRDSIISNGSNGQSFTSLSFRTFRYLQIIITTKEDALVMDDIYGTFTGFPFQLKAKLESDNPELDKMMEIGWRTARLCAVETYTDCPYYEQLQYIGDARIQAMVSLYNTADDRLLRNALNQMNNSRLPEGVTLSRHPSYTPQYIPTFSLWYIGMLHDYLMYGKDFNFIKNKLAGERAVLNYFKGYQQADGSLKGVPNWMFTDWVEKKGWQSGVGPIGKNGNSAMLDFQLVWAYQLAADMESRIGMKEYAAAYLQSAEQLKKTLKLKYWDNSKGLFADREEKDLFSQHSNALAILTGTVTAKEAISIGKKLLDDKSLAPASIYFKYYLHLALTKAGYGNDYIKWLDIWRENIKMGLTTWAEISDINNARSDCHAWGASPNIEFFRTILGIDSDAPGFAKLKIEPHLGIIKNISGEMPHPNGMIAVHYTNSNGKWTFEIILPAKITGNFFWKGKSYPLKEGKNVIYL